ncbi:uncharacterized protein At3g43530-like [Eutrema salsugineum]|uniref:uncharacterized protein At3g43530-like n=1 Tax=Eutrema salsugineum TaxID=72664 RepID=UPI000CECFABE|nr:uncharacterized protein At3g43530-like [Eutrema salsugineum]
MLPEKLYFGPTTYIKGCRILIRYSVRSVADKIDNLEEEKTWFKAHPQFKHIFHMFKEPNHMNQGLWMLLLHTAHTERLNECWRACAFKWTFDCRDYPANNKNLGNMKFVEKHFGRMDKIKIAEVKAKLDEMKDTSVDRKKKALLMFLCKVVKAKYKSDGNIDPFLLRVVSDLNVCKMFLWGRYTFDDMMKEIRHVMAKYNGSVKVKKQNILAFECIPSLGRKFREAVHVQKDCLRMCKHKFTDVCMKGIPLDDINAAIGTSAKVSV